MVWVGYYFVSLSHDEVCLCEIEFFREAGCITEMEMKLRDEPYSFGQFVSTGWRLSLSKGATNKSGVELLCNELPLELPPNLPEPSNCQLKNGFMATYNYLVDVGRGANSFQF